MSCNGLFAVQLLSNVASNCSIGNRPIAWLCFVQLLSLHHETYCLLSLFVSTSRQFQYQHQRVRWQAGTGNVSRLLPPERLMVQQGAVIHQHRPTNENIEVCIGCRGGASVFEPAPGFMWMRPSRPSVGQPKTRLICETDLFSTLNSANHPDALRRTPLPDRYPVQSRPP